MKKMIDERVQQESHGVMAKNFRITMVLLAVLLAAKAVSLLLGLPWHVLLPEIAGLGCGGVTWLIWMSLRGLWGQADERVTAERAVCLSISWTVTYCVAVLVCAAVMFVDQHNNLAYGLTSLAMTLILYVNMGRMTQKGLYNANVQGSVWQRMACIMGLLLVLSPVLLWLMGQVRNQTYELWVYIAVEVIMVVSCVLGGVLAKSLTRRSSANAEEQLKAAEGSDEE